MKARQRVGWILGCSLVCSPLFLCAQTLELGTLTLNWSEVSNTVAHVAETGRLPADMGSLSNAVASAVEQLGVDVSAYDFSALVDGLPALYLRPYLPREWAEGRAIPDLTQVRFSREEWRELADVALQVITIAGNVTQREQTHRQALAARGVAEEPMSSAACRFEAILLNHAYLFDRWGELFVDHRFLSEDEKKVVSRFEAFYKKAYETSGLTNRVATSNVLEPRAVAMAKLPVPIFRGFEDERYQAHDAIIARMVRDFNKRKAFWSGGTVFQAARIGDLTPALVKAQMIEESGGNGLASRAAWQVDPLQVNVPGDWGIYKPDLGLRKPERRNEGTLEQNVRAAIMFLSRKGFGVSGQPAANRPNGFFDGWKEALRRYNGRRERTLAGRLYDEAYATKIMARAHHPDRFVPISIPLLKIEKHAEEK